MSNKIGRISQGVTFALVTLIHNNAHNFCRTYDYEAGFKPQMFFGQIFTKQFQLKKSGFRLNCSSSVIDAKIIVEKYKSESKL